MAWDTDRTKRMLMDAAVEEFAGHGYAGGRANRIAARAGVNKKRLYGYLGSKVDLLNWSCARLAGVAAAVLLQVEQDGQLDRGAPTSSSWRIPCAVPSCDVAVSLVQATPQPTRSITPAASITLSVQGGPPRSPCACSLEPPDEAVRHPVG
ncbi:TetR/AcrR family transcriptional regulator [Nocardioides sp. Soil805]|uniref:TetR/AcrR family transcriptional regulator n=1 Tax=Nocardioides sp. Soil805 TaxID=1736416 RepID=UPI0009E6D528|nr:TetR/AcrR family transcriptional regulator [Nocardioides sp. Soil805]